MAEQTILIVEDSDAQREAQLLALEMRGFSARGAKNVKEAREAIDDLGENLAVMVLDMRLDDPDAPGVTGADIGLGMRRSNPPRMPELLILSAYSKVEYYKLAVQLRVSAYMPKEDTGIELLIHHIRALLVRRNLCVDDPEVSRKIARIADESHKLSDASARFCSEVVSPILTEFLGAPHVIMFGDDQYLGVFDGESKTWEGGKPFYKKLDRLIHGQVGTDEPFVLNKDLLHGMDCERDIGAVRFKLYEKAAFWPVPLGRDIRLAFGVLPSTKKLADNPKDLAVTLSRYLQRPLLEALFGAIAAQLVSKARSEAQLLAHSCGYLGEEAIAILTDSTDERSIEASSDSYRKLMILSESLRDTGQILMMVNVKQSESAADSIRMGELLQEVGKDLDKPWFVKNSRIEGACSVTASRGDLYIAMKRILQWFAYRMLAAKSEDSPFLQVKLEELPEAAQIVFEDRGSRLPRRLRDRLFSPFAQPMPASRDESEGAGLYFPLYLAKTLIELKLGGSLADCSDELPGKAGHRFVIRFPRAA